MKRPDNVYYGMGPGSLQSSQSRYGETKFDASVSVDDRYWRSGHVHGAFGLRRVDLFDGHFGGDPNITEQVDARVYPTPYGFNRGYLAPYSQLLATFDTRKPGKPGTGVRFEAESEQGTDLEHSPASGWVRYGATGAFYVDLNDHGRVLGVKVGALFADPLGSGQVPFTELVTLGGDKWMQGYFPGRLVDRSAAVAELSYTWPVAPSIDATMVATVGNVFGEHLSDFHPSFLRFSGALGLSSRTSDPPIQFLIGFGTETFDHGAQVDSFRLSVGIPRSF